MAVKIICDLCGKETQSDYLYNIPTYEFENTLVPQKRLKRIVVRHLQLCEECEKELAEKVDSLQI